MWCSSSTQLGLLGLACILMSAIEHTHYSQVWSPESLDAKHVLEHTLHLRIPREGSRSPVGLGRPLLHSQLPQQPLAPLAQLSLPLQQGLNATFHLLNGTLHAQSTANVACGWAAHVAGHMLWCDSMWASKHLFKLLFNVLQLICKRRSSWSAVQGVLLFFKGKVHCVRHLGWLPLVQRLSMAVGAGMLAL